MGDVVKQNDWSRREFLGTSAAAGASLAASTVRPLPRDFMNLVGAAPGDPVRFGMIGIGMQGSGLLANAITLPGVECVAAADLYTGRLVLAREIVRPDLPATRRYQALLDNTDIGCILAAVPVRLQQEVAADALSTGQD